MRNRWRRSQAPDPIRDEITPSNIILIGPTGVGKTEIARRLARLAGAPFVKVEASKFTEVGYVGRDVEGMVRDLVDAAVNLVRTEREDEVFPAGGGAGGGEAARICCFRRSLRRPATDARTQDAADPTPKRRAGSARGRSSGSCWGGKLDEREVEIEVTPRAIRRWT